MSFWDDNSIFIDLTDSGMFCVLDVLNVLKENLKPSELEEFKESL